MTEHQHLNLYDATLFKACGIAWKLWHVDFDPASPSMTTLLLECNFCFICQDIDAARRPVRRDSSIHGSNAPPASTILIQSPFDELDSK